MKVLKTVVGGPVVQQFLYTNICIHEEDGYIVRKAKNSIRGSYNHWIRDPVRALQVTIGCNFSDGGYFVTLTFSDETLPVTREQVSRRFWYFTHKLKRMGYPVRYIKNIEHRHGAGRWHMHCIIAGPPQEAIRSAWHYGHVHIRPIILRDVFPNPENVQYQGGGLANYMVKELREKPGQRLFQCSRGLKRPEATRQLVDDEYYLTAPGGCLFIEKNEPVVNNYGSSARITYLLPPSGN